MHIRCTPTNKIARQQTLFALTLRSMPHCPACCPLLRPRQPAYIQQLAADYTQPLGKAAASHLRAILHLLPEAMRTIPLQAWGKAQYADWEAAIRQHPLMPATQNAYLHRLHHLLSYAHDNGLCPLRPQRPKSARGPALPKIPLPLQTARNIVRLACLSTDRRLLLCAGALLTGLRKSDLLSLSWKLLAQDGSYLLYAQKDGTRLQGQIPSPLLAALRRARPHHPPACRHLLFGCPPSFHGHQAVGMLQRYGFHLPQGFSFHGFRHTAASLLYHASNDVRSSQLLLGHASLLSTQTYLGIPQQHPAQQSLQGLLLHSTTPLCATSPPRR